MSKSLWPTCMIKENRSYYKKFKTSIKSWFSFKNEHRVINPNLGGFLMGSF